MLVYKQMDQAALDRQYDNRRQVPDYAEYFIRWESLSRATAEKLLVITDVYYGSLDRERLDVYPSPKPHSKTLVFIHGGYWHLLDKALFHFIADRFHDYGVTTVLLTYPMAPEASMDQMVLSCRTAVQWLYQNIHTYNGDPQQLFVAGHSAGAHLAAMVLATDWHLFNPEVPANVLKGVCLVSGLFDLLPIYLSYLNKNINMDQEAALRNSPVRLPPATDCPLLIAVGAAETAAFNDQSQALYESWKHKLSDTLFLQLPGLHHFSIVDAMVDPDAALHKVLCQLMEVN